MGKVYYLDTNICIFHMRKPFGEPAKKINAIDLSCIKLSAIVKGELLVGGRRAKAVKRLSRRLSLSVCPMRSFRLTTL